MKEATVAVSTGSENTTLRALVPKDFTSATSGNLLSIGVNAKPFASIVFSLSLSWFYWRTGHTESGKAFKDIIPYP